MWLLNMLKNKFAISYVFMKWYYAYSFPTETFRDPCEISVTDMFILDIRLLIYLCKSIKFCDPIRIIYEVQGYG